jgi:competence protein ComEA
MWKDLFDFSAKERKAVRLLIILTILVVSMRWVIPPFLPEKTWDFSEFESEVTHFMAETGARVEESKPDSVRVYFMFDPNTATIEEMIKLGMTSGQAGSVIRYREKGGSFREKTDLKKIYTMNNELYHQLEPFIAITEKQPSEQKKHAPGLNPVDPNLADLDELTGIGFPERLAERVISYRSKGGTYKKSTDLKKIYGMSEKIWERISPFLVFPNEPDKPVSSEETPINLIQINLVTAEELAAIPDIGPDAAGKIIRFRERLGGFYHPEQIRETWGIHPKVFNILTSMITIDTLMIHRLEINFLDEKELSKHPYIDRETAKNIIKYRNKEGFIESGQALLDAGIIKDSVFVRIKPYLPLPLVP